jgi:hypothetical protein
MTTSYADELRSYYETKNFPPLYDAYAMWAKDNPTEIKIGDTVFQKPISKMKRPYGFRKFLLTFMNEKTEMSEVKTCEQQGSEYLGNYPDKFVEEAKIFCEILPGVISAKLANKKKRDELDEEITMNGLNQLFEQKSLKLEDPVRKVSSDDTVQKIRDLGASGAKSVKSPDGWEVQF